MVRPQHFVAAACFVASAACGRAVERGTPVARVVQPAIGSRSAPVLTLGGLRFRDLNRNGRLDPYEDWRLAPDARARDLVARMTLEEKAGAMMHGTARSLGRMGAAGTGAGYDTTANRVLIDSTRVTSLITRLRGDPGSLAEQNNLLQAIAERTRLGIPLTISTDPRHHFRHVLGAAVAPGQFSQWPEPLGFAAIDDTALTRRFGDIARREYRAVGVHMALSPQADLATEPRWSRIDGTFGEDADLAARHVRAYIAGFQHGVDGVDSAGGATVVKHWVGYGAAREGFDSHNYYGRFAAISDGNLAYHVRPFEAAFAAHAAGVMPTYSILDGATWRDRAIEPVGAGFNRDLLSGMLREQYGFRGIVLTDWAITNDCGSRCREGVPAGERPSFADLGMPWGVEGLSMRARFVKGVRAGVDQFGGTERADLLVQAVRAGELTEARLDSSVQRIMALKFALGLFENPYVDAERAARIVGAPEFRASGIEAQRRALVLLEQRDALLPLRPPSASGRLRVYTHGISPDAIERAGWVVANDPGDADVAIMRLSAPFETLHPGYVFGAMQHEGSLAYRDDDPDVALLRRVSARVPTIVAVYLDRPAILTPVREHAAVLLANFGVSDDALLDVLAGRAAPEGRLPFELPSSMNAVTEQRPDVPHDSRAPLYPFGFGRQDVREWTQLFDGRTLDGWTPKFAGYPLGENVRNTFRVDSGLLMVRYDQWNGFNGEFGHLFYRRQPFSYYLVAAEYRFVGKQVAGADARLAWAVRNNGIMVHSQSAESMGLRQDFPMSLEVQLLGGLGTGARTTGNLCTPGTHVHFGDSLVTEHCINSTSKTYDGDQWVRVEALVLGDSVIKHIVNGDTVLVYRKPVMGGGFANNMKDGVRVDGAALTSGYIALQAETAPIDFRKVELLNLAGCMDPRARNYHSYYVKSEPSSCRY